MLYIFLGAIGLPVFAQTADGTMGLARLIGPTGGYLLAFPIAAYLVGLLTEKNQKYLTVIISMFVAELVVISFGTLYLYAAYLHNFVDAVKAGAAIFTVWMAVKVFAAATIYFAVAKKQPRLPSNFMISDIYLMTIKNNIFIIVFLFAFGFLSWSLRNLFLYMKVAKRKTTGLMMLDEELAM